MLGLKRGTVQLYEHEQEWEIEAQNTILRLKEILRLQLKTLKMFCNLKKNWQNKYRWTMEEKNI